MTMLCEFETTEVDGGYKHTCKRCGVSKTLPSKRYVRQCKPGISPQEPRRSRCAHLGEPTGEVVTCTTCTGAKLKTFACSIHGVCTIEKPAAGVKLVCRTCTDFVES